MKAQKYLVINASDAAITAINSVKDLEFTVGYKVSPERFSKVYFIPMEWGDEVVLRFEEMGLKHQISSVYSIREGVDFIEDRKMAHPRRIVTQAYTEAESMEVLGGLVAVKQQLRAVRNYTGIWLRVYLEEQADGQVRITLYDSKRGHLNQGYFANVKGWKDSVVKFFSGTKLIQPVEFQPACVATIVGIADNRYE